jgi:hypothetical protein
MTVMIGVDPHKGSHTAVAVDESEQALAEFKVRTGPDQVCRSLDSMTVSIRSQPVLRLPCQIACQIRDAHKGPFAPGTRACDSESEGRRRKKSARGCQIGARSETQVNRPWPPWSCRAWAVILSFSGDRFVLAGPALGLLVR